MSSIDQGRKPPRFGEWLLRSFCSYDFLNTALWDLQELYELNTQQKGRLKADILYLKEVFSIIYHLYTKGKSQYSTNLIAMLKINIILAFRSFKKDKSYSILNIIGLSSAMVILLLTSTYVFYELSYDRHYEGSDNIYRVYKSVNTIDDTDYRDAGTPGPLAKAMVNEFPEVLSVTRFIRYRNILMETEEAKFVEPLVIPADPDVLDVFSLDLVSGGEEDFLGQPYTAAISRSVALKYFNRTNVVGETIQFQGQLPIQVSGVFEDIPENSHFKLDVLVHFESVMEVFGQDMTRWNNNPYFTYIKVKEGTDPDALEFKLPQLREKYAGDPLDEDGQLYTYFLQPLKDVHFNQKIEGGIARPVDAQRFYIYLSIAVIIMIIACINYINLATARSLIRMKEIGVRKVVGARKVNLVFQFLTESGILVFTSLLLSVLVANLLLPDLARFVDQPLELALNSPGFWGILAIVGIVLTLVSGIYPGLVSTSFKPVNALYGRGIAGKKGSAFRNVLVVFQFAISSMLIVGAIVLGKQLDYIDTLNTGYKKENVLVLRTIDDTIEENLAVYMEELGKVPGVSTVATSWSLPTNITSNTRANWTGITDPERLPMYQLGVTYDFFELYEIELTAGRFFDRTIPTDEQAVILNETAVKQLGWESPLGHEMIVQGTKGRVIGVVKDFHLKSLREEIEPLQIILNEDYAILSVKIGGDLFETIKKIEEVYQSFSPSYPFQYRLFEDIYDEAYTAETKTAQLTLWLTAITVIIACLGLYGLAAHRVQHRVKELGVRKVMGASGISLIVLLFKDLLKPLVIAFLLAVPLVYFIMKDWLNGFAYHIDMDSKTFLISLILMLLIAGLTVSHRTYKAATSNPVDALRDE